MIKHTLSKPTDTVLSMTSSKVGENKTSFYTHFISLSDFICPFLSLPCSTYHQLVPGIPSNYISELSVGTYLGHLHDHW